MRVVDVFVDELDLTGAGLRGRGAGGDRAAGVPPGGAAEDLHLRLSEPHPVQPAPGARDAAQRRADVADRPPDAGLQDHRRLPQGQRQGDPQRLPRVHRAVPPARSCSPRRSWPSTAASSRRSTTATRTSPTASSRRAWSSSRRASRATWRSWTARTGEPTLVTEAQGRAAQGEDRDGQGADAASSKQIGQQLQEAPDGQISLTDPDARSMATSGRGTGIVGYNVQTAVDTKHHLIVAHEVTNVGHDRDPAVRDGRAGARGDRARRADGPCRSRLLQGRGDPGVRRRPASRRWCPSR